MSPPTLTQRGGTNPVGISIQVGICMMLFMCKISHELLGGFLLNLHGCKGVMKTCLGLGDLALIYKVTAGLNR